MGAYEDALHEHVHSFFARHPAAIRTCDQSAVLALVPDFHVIEIAPGPRTERWTYITVGAGNKPPENGRPLEFVLCSNESAERHVQLLYLTAFFHLTGETLDVGHTFPIDQPWLPGSKLDCFLVSLPYPFGPELEVFDQGSYHAHLLWLVPITQFERQFARKAGYQALEELLEKRRVNYSDPKRRPVVKAEAD
jgi:hypothetical protein